MKTRIRHGALVWVALFSLGSSLADHDTHRRAICDIENGLFAGCFAGCDTVPCGGEGEIACDLNDPPDWGSQDPVTSECQGNTALFSAAPWFPCDISCGGLFSESIDGVCYECGHPGQLRCQGQSCRNGGLSSFPSELTGDGLAACPDFIPSSIPSSSHCDLPTEIEFVEHTGICSNGHAEVLSGASREAWPTAPAELPVRGTIIAIHGRGSSCSAFSSTLTQSMAERNYLTYCVEYNQAADPSMVRVYPMMDGAGGFDTARAVAAARASEHSFAGIADATARAISALPTEGGITLIPHSQGGFVMRALLHRHYDDLRWQGKAISRVISLAHPFFGVLVDPSITSGWACYLDDENLEDCGVLRWLWGWSNGLAGEPHQRIDNVDFPQIEWTTVAGDGFEADGMTPAFPQVLDGFDDNCIRSFGGVDVAMVPGDGAVGIASSSGIDEHDFYPIDQLQFDQQINVPCTHDGTCLIQEALATLGDDLLPVAPPRDPTPTGGLEFDGNDQVAISDPAAIAALTMSDALTLEAWVRPTVDGFSQQTVLSKGGEYRLEIWPWLTWSLGGFGGGDVFDSDYQVPIGRWTHVALTYDSATGVVNLYANGVLVDSESGGGPFADLDPAHNELRIGGREDGLIPALVGGLDEVRVWSRALSRTEILAGLGADAGAGDLSGLVAWWRFDEAGGDTLLDSSVNAFDASLSGAGDPIRRADARESRVSSGLYFDGVNDHAAVTDPAALADLEMSDALTIEAWIFPRGPGGPVGGGVIVNKEGEYALTRWGDGRITWSFANQTPGWTSTQSNHIAAAHVWMHVALTYDGSFARLYVNGALAQQWSAEGAIGDFHPASDELRIGNRQNGGQPFHGVIDEVRVWNRTRSAAEIAADYRHVVDAGSATGLVGYWRFSEHEAGVAFDEVGGHDATLGGSKSDQVPGTADPATLPGYPLDTDSDGLTDSFEVIHGFDPEMSGDEVLDPDGDGLDNLGEQAAGTDPHLADTDEDGQGDGSELNAGTDPNDADSDDDSIQDGGDNCPLVPNIAQSDQDTDGFGDACDNCLADPNPTQVDIDTDDQGDRCDLDDGLLLLDLADDQLVVWQNEIVYSSFNLYRGVLSALRLTGVYTQFPGEPDAARFCDLVAPDLLDPFVPPAGEGVFYLVTGTHDGVESGLGALENGEPRPSTNPCP